jgi:hypothetical protein
MRTAALFLGHRALDLLGHHLVAQLGVRPTLALRLGRVGLLASP